MEEEKKGFLVSAKNVSLLALVFQQVALVLMIRHSRMRQGDPYITSTAVVTAELLKFVLNFSLEFFLVKEESVVGIVKGIASPEAFKLGIPALLYVIQNNLLFVALGNLTVPIYQVSNQGKLLTTAFFSRCMLNKSISTMQYVSLVVLALGVALVQLSSVEKKGTDVTEDQNQLLGLLAVFLSCCTSGAAGVYFEKILKSSTTVSVYTRNCQLSFFSVVLGLFPVLFHDYQTIQENGFFKGYDAVVVGVIVCQAMTGLIVGLVMKYADTILKGFATSVAVVLATVLSIFIWNAQVDGWFVVGAAMVILAVRLYSSYPTGEPFELKAPGLLRLLLLAGAAICAMQLFVLQTDNMTTSQSVRKALAEFAATPSKTHVATENGNTGQQLTKMVVDHSNDMQCKIRDVSTFPKYVSWKDEGSRTDRWAHCLRFQCLNNHTFCDNHEPTNFDGPEPPCCVHILRDMAHEFDRAMCYLGLEYFPAFGMLLGLVRADKLIPWTIDNDYIMTEDMLSAMQQLWPTAEHLNHGLGFHFDLVYRLCATPTFADGKLAAKWKVNETDSWYADSTYPFADIFSADFVNATHVMDQRECYHSAADLRPTVRRPVYGGSFYQQFPQISEPVLETFFGTGWRTPDNRKSSHGGTHCGRRRARQEARRKKREAAAKAAVEAKKKKQVVA